MRLRTLLHLLSLQILFCDPAHISPILLNLFQFTERTTRRAGERKQNADFPHRLVTANCLHAIMFAASCGLLRSCVYAKY